MRNPWRSPTVENASRLETGQVLVFRDSTVIQITVAIEGAVDQDPDLLSSAYEPRGTLELLRPHPSDPNPLELVNDLIELPV